MSKKVKLVAGGNARIFRRSGDSRVLHSQIATGPGGGVAVRHLDPGEYVACDEAGNDVEFEVTADVEFVTLPVHGKPLEAPAQPKIAHRDVTKATHVLKKPPAKKAARKPASKPAAKKPTGKVQAVKPTVAKRVRKPATEAQKAARRERDRKRRAKAKA